MSVGSGLLLCSIPYRYWPRYISSCDRFLSRTLLPARVRSRTLPSHRKYGRWQGTVVAWTAEPSFAIVYSRGRRKGRGRVGSSINFSTRNVADRGLRLVPRAWSMISRHEIRFTSACPRLLFSSFIDGSGIHVKDMMIYPGRQKTVLLGLSVYESVPHRLIKHRGGTGITVGHKFSLPTVPIL